MNNALVLLTLLDQLLARASSIGALIRKARVENREISDEELTQLAANDDLVKVALDAEIAKARAEGR